MLVACHGRLPDNYQQWNKYSGGYAGSKYSALDQINTDNVHLLDTA
jgi:glucose dehydrogenase